MFIRIAYPRRVHLQGPYKHAVSNALQEVSMSGVRESVEWLFQSTWARFAEDKTVRPHVNMSTSRRRVNISPCLSVAIGH